MASSPNAMASTRKSLLSRPLDVFYFTFLVAHFFIAILIDLQAFYPPSLLAYFPKALLQAPVDYLEMSGDFLVKSLEKGYTGRPDEYAWFWALSLGLEGAVQIPTTFLGAIGIWRDSKKIWVLLIIYGSTTAASLLPCFATIYFAPTTGTALALPGLASLTLEQKKFITYNYLPFFIIPLMITVDGAVRLWKAIPCANAPHSKTE